MNRRLDDEVVLVTGAARGPGRADCIAGGAPGGRVVAGDLAGGDETVVHPPTDETRFVTARTPDGRRWSRRHLKH